MSTAGPPLNLYKKILVHEVIFSSHTMFINASTKEFTPVNNTIPSYDMAFKHLLYYTRVANVY